MTIMRNTNDGRRRFRDGEGRRSPLAIEPKALDLFFDMNAPDDAEVGDGIAIVSICGPLEQHRSWWFDSYESILDRVESALEQEEVRAVVLKIDSPGGDAAGCTEAHKKIRRLRAKHGKPIFAFADEAMCSAAYAIGSAADEVWTTQTGSVGSIGVICELFDVTEATKRAGIRVELITTGERKGDGHEHKPLTDDVRAAFQRRVDRFGAAFFKVVSAARGMSVEDVRALEAGVFMGSDAVSRGIADGVSTWDDFLSTVRSSLGIEIQSLDSNSTNVSRVKRKQSTAARETDTMKTILQLTKERDDAAKALAGAKSEDRAKLQAAYEAAVTALADAQAEERYKKTKRTTTTEEYEENSEEEEAEEDAEDEDAEEDAGDSDGGSSTGGSSASSSTGAEDAKSLAMLSASSGLHTFPRLFRLCQQITGKRDVREVFGALDGMGQRLKAAGKLETRIAKLEKTSRDSKVKSLLDRAVRDRKITPAARTKLATQDPKWLKGYLESLPSRAVRSEEDAIDPNPGAVPTSLDGQNLTEEQRKILTTMASGTGKSVEDFAAEMGKVNTSNGGARPRV